MKTKVLLMILAVATVPMWAQQAPENLSYRTSPTAVELCWEQPGFEKTTLFNEGELITHHGVGYAGADVSMYPYQTVGISALHQASRKAADDFTLFDYDEDYDAAYLSDLVFYVFPSNYFDYTKSPVTEVFVEIYDDSPMNGGQLMYSTQANVKKKDVFINAFRLMKDYSYSDRYMPIFEITADLGIVLPTIGPYWLVFTYSADQNCFLPLRTDWGQFVTGNALFYNNGSWNYIAQNPDNNPGLAFKINGTWLFNDQTRVIGFNIYRDGVKVNDFLVTESHFLDDGLRDETSYTYRVEAVLSDDTSVMSDSLSVHTPPLLGVENVEVNVDVNEIQLDWERPAVEDKVSLTYNIYLDEQFIQNVEDTHFSRGFFERGSYSFRVDAVYFNHMTIPGEPCLVYVSDCFPPLNLSATADDNHDVTLIWDEPIESYLVSSFSGEKTNFLGTSNFYCEWAIGHRYLPEDLEPYDGLAITKVSFYAGGPENVYTLQIYTDNGFGGPDDMIYSQSIPSFKMNEKNVIYLETPVMIDADVVMWVVVNSCQTAPGYVFGLSDEYVDLKSNFIYRDWGADNTSGWDTYDSGGCIEIYLGGDSKVSSKSREECKYNIFKDDNLLVANFPENTYVDYGLETGIYRYGVQSVNGDGTSAVREVSVKVGNVGIDEVESTVSEVYPNPGGNWLYIRTALRHAQVEFYDLTGKLIHNQQITDNITPIATTSWPSGTYIWKVIANGKEVESGKWIKE